ncbi:phosphate acetyltransferase [Kiritimatiellaeota bacterium B1221]|nr:phosphate acetyltransferase [Kiritimatiellaeota bacterium B1221]
MSTKKQTQCIYLVPTGARVGLTSVSMGLVRALDRNGIKAAFFKPVAQLFRGDTGPERSTFVIRNTTDLTPPDPIPYAKAEKEISANGVDSLLESVLERYQPVADEADIVVVEGLIHMDEFEHAIMLNKTIARTLDASLVFVGAPIKKELSWLDAEIRNAVREFGEINSERVMGAIVNFVNAPRDANGRLRPDLELASPEQEITRERIKQECDIFQEKKFRLLGTIPWVKEMAQSRTIDVARHLQAQILNEGEIHTRRIHKVFLCARNVEHITHVFRANALLIIPIDRMDLFLAACMAAANGIPLAGVLLTSAGKPSDEIMKLCQNAMEKGLPVMTVPTDSYSTATQIPHMNTEVPIDDQERIDTAMNYIASQISRSWLKSLVGYHREIRLSPAAFRYRLVQLSRKKPKRIVLPEGIEPRTLQAANICQQRQIANCVLLANPEDIHEMAEKTGLVLEPGLEILDPDTLRDGYVDILQELRKHKGMDRSMAASLLEDNVMLGTVMLKNGDVDGLVSGAVHTTAQTVRPALQLIKTKPGTRFVSSLFFMLLPEQVYIYADCAINENPDAETLAEIALQSADSATAFGITPRVAMISYSTGASGSGDDVEKVRKATEIAREKRPDLSIDGPLQYDAASTLSVAKTKAPGSEVAGKANVYIFPDLNTGNTTYKAVQRSANVISIGPMLQGLNKPVNDLSRGALVDDIVYTIALTAIQAGQA